MIVFQDVLFFGKDKRYNNRFVISLLKVLFQRVKEAWDALLTHTFTKSFKKTGISNTSEHRFTGSNPEERMNAREKDGIRVAKDWKTL